MSYDAHAHVSHGSPYVITYSTNLHTCITTYTISTGRPSKPGELREPIRRVRDRRVVDPPVRPGPVMARPSRRPPPHTGHVKKLGPAQKQWWQGLTVEVDNGYLETQVMLPTEKNPPTVRLKAGGWRPQAVWPGATGSADLEPMSKSER
eukprot:g80703.t1